MTRRRARRPGPAPGSAQRQHGGLRVAVVVGHPAQHFVDAFTLLAQEPGLDAEVMYWDLREGGYSDPSFRLRIEWDVDLTSTYPHWAPSGGRAAGRALQFLGRLRSHRPDVILCFGWSTPSARVAIAFAHACRVPILYYGDSTWQHSDRPGLRVPRAAVLRVLFSRRHSGAVSTGTFNREFYVLNGMDPRRIHPGVYPVDTDPFVAAAAAAAPSLSSADDRDEPVSIAFAGKFVDRKAPSHVIAAAALLPRSPPWHVTMIGEGPLRGELEAAVARAGLADKVTFSGFKNTSEMPAMLADADIVVVPSTRDMRVVVTTEAMAAGAVPVVSSATAVWGTGDLVEDDVTGVVYPVGDLAALASALAGLVADRERRARLADAAHRRALEHDSDDFARLAGDALRSSASRRDASPAHLRGVRLKVALANAATHPAVGRIVARIAGNSVRVAGVRIGTASPLITDRTRAQLALGLYERAELRFVRRHLRTDLDVIELGSSIGVVGSVVLRRLQVGRRLISVEADRDLGAIARSNLGLNARGATWQLDEAIIAYGSQAGLSFVKGRDTTVGRLTRTSVVEPSAVERVTLSELLERHHIGRYALISDVEGAEAGIIAEDAPALARCEQIIIELHDTETATVAEQRSMLIAQHGFVVTAARGPVLVMERPRGEAIADHGVRERAGCDPPSNPPAPVRRRPGSRRLR